MKRREDGEEDDRPFSQRIFWWDEVPVQLQYNKFIRSGYRAGLSRQQCLCSMLQYHNETGNIHSHFLPALLILIALAGQKLTPWPLAKLAFLECIIPILLCLFGSTIYHTFMANHWHYKTYLLIDVCGIFLVLVTGAGTGTYWGLQCYPHLCSGFIISYYTSAALLVVSVLKAKTQLGRATPMVGLLAVRFGAVIARLVLKTGSQRAGWYYLAMEGTAIIGAIVNVTRVPERLFFPRQGPDAKCRKAGPFDYWLNSHQIMHILVLCAIAFKYIGLKEDYTYRMERQIACPASL